MIGQRKCQDIKDCDQQLQMLFIEHWLYTRLCVRRCGARGVIYRWTRYCGCPQRVYNLVGGWEQHIEMCTNQVSADCDTFHCRTTDTTLGACEGKIHYSWVEGSFLEVWGLEEVKNFSSRKGKIKDSRGRNYMSRDVDASGGWPVICVGESSRDLWGEGRL